MPDTTEHIFKIFRPESCLIDAAAATPDSLSVLPNLTGRTSASDIFGICSYIPSDSMTSRFFVYHYSPAFQIIVLLLLLACAIIMLRFRHQTVSMLRSAWASGQSDYNGDYDMSDTSFRAMIMFCNALMWGVLAVWTLKLWNTIPNLPYIAAPNDWSTALLFAAIAAGTAVMKRYAIMAAGLLTLSNDFVKLLNLKRFSFCVSSVICAAPPILSGILVVGQWKYFAFATALIILLANTGIYIWKSFCLFVKQKISILVWILYLCSVELIPITIVVLTAIRNWSV